MSFPLQQHSCVHKMQVGFSSSMFHQQPVVRQCPEDHIDHSTADVTFWRRWGQGHCRFTDGSVYEGEWVCDMRHGSGRMTLSDGTVYEGQWQDDKQHGSGEHHPHCLHKELASDRVAA